MKSLKLFDTENTIVLLAALLILFIYHIAVVCLKQRRIRRQEKEINELFRMVSSTQTIANDQNETMRKQAAQIVRLQNKVQDRKTKNAERQKRHRERKKAATQQSEEEGGK
jgi:type II secretory pathway component PulM